MQFGEAEHLPSHGTEAPATDRTGGGVAARGAAFDQGGRVWELNPGCGGAPPRGADHDERRKQNAADGCVRFPEYSEGEVWMEAGNVSGARTAKIFGASAFDFETLIAVAPRWQDE